MNKNIEVIINSNYLKLNCLKIRTVVSYLKIFSVFVFLLPAMLFAQNNADCKSAFPICELGSYHFQNLLGHGIENENLNALKCAENDFREINSQWLKFKIEESGTLIFSINPEDELHDIDFVLFKSDNFELNSLQEVRCMASGKNYGSSLKSQNDCLGSTGLNMSSQDVFESSGCKFNDDNFLKFLKAQKDEEYVLFVNDYHDNGSISLTFEGSAKLSQLNECKNETFESLQILSIYPNPAEDEISITFSSHTDSQIVIDIIDMNSNLIYTDRQSIVGNRLDSKIDVQNLASGSYVLRTRQGKQVAVKSFIKI